MLNPNNPKKFIIFNKILYISFYHKFINLFYEKNSKSKFFKEEFILKKNYKLFYLILLPETPNSFMREWSTGYIHN
jgi:hypothetical protein